MILAYQTKKIQKEIILCNMYMGGKTCIKLASNILGKYFMVA